MWLTDTSELVQILKDKGVSRVALQFPEGLKRQSAGIAMALKDAGFFVIISGDPCYGACDLATGLLEHVDVLVHFGHSPLDSDPRILYEPFTQDFDVGSLELAIPYLTEKETGLVTTVQHAHMVPAAEEYFARRNIICRAYKGTRRTPFPGQILGCSFEAAKKCPGAEILFIGTGSFHPLGVALATGKKVIALDPYSLNIEIISVERFLRRRFALIEKARKAKNFGIILSQKSGQRRQDLAERLAGLKKEAIVIAMEEITPDELLNLGFSAYVNTACPRLAYDDQSRFPVPVLTPGEFEILCGVSRFEDYKVDEIT
ncbi:MAG TPA: diphthamide biosynthesis enzyme Dph2 [Methanoregulaceae archaeon]|nr:diphthamide biosynthesis enzyme Dph2 [Methanoregulaceae archaeon]